MSTHHSPSPDISYVVHNIPSRPATNDKICVTQHSDITWSPQPRGTILLTILKRVQAGINRIRMLKGSPPRIRLPIAVYILEKIHTALIGSADPDICAIAVTAFFGWGNYYRHHRQSSSQQRAYDIPVDNHANPQMVESIQMQSVRHRI